MPRNSSAESWRDGHSGVEKEDLNSSSEGWGWCKQLHNQPTTTFSTLSVAAPAEGGTASRPRIILACRFPMDYLGSRGCWAFTASCSKHFVACHIILLAHVASLPAGVSHFIAGDVAMNWLRQGRLGRSTSLQCLFAEGVLRRPRHEEGREQVRE